MAVTETPQQPQETIAELVRKRCSCVDEINARCLLGLWGLSPAEVDCEIAGIKKEIQGRGLPGDVAMAERCCEKCGDPAETMEPRHDLGRLVWKCFRCARTKAPIERPSCEQCGESLVRLLTFQGSPLWACPSEQGITHAVL